MISMVSGGFDPLHVGHLDLIDMAAGYGNVIVVLNSDDWLFRKKGYVFMPFADRSRILRALVNVRDVTPVNDADGTVCEAIRRIRPYYFVNGGDRKIGDIREDELCRKLSVLQVFGGLKIRSSQELVKAIR